jgi:hypothetical protein
VIPVSLWIRRNGFEAQLPLWQHKFCSSHCPYVIDLPLVVV